MFPGFFRESVFRFAKFLVSLTLGHVRDCHASISFARHQFGEGLGELHSLLQFNRVKHE